MPSVDRPADHAQRGRLRAFGVPRSQHPADDHLARDGNRVEDERQEEEQLQRDLVRAELGIPHARTNRSRNEEAREQRGRADEDLAADAQHGPHRLEAGRFDSRVRAQQLDHERDPHACLGDRCPRCRAGDAPAEPVHEQQLEHDVPDVRRDHYLERTAKVRDSPEVALSCESDKRGRQAERRDAEVRRRVVAGLPVRAESTQERVGERLA